MANPVPPYRDFPTTCPDFTRTPPVKEIKEGPKPAHNGYKDIDSRRHVIEELYWEEDRELHKVMDIMKSRHHFKASARMYKTAFKRWGLQKNILAEDMRHMARIRKRRQEEGKQTQFSLYTRPVSAGKIERWIKRTRFEVPRETWDVLPGRHTPPCIRYTTPSEANSFPGAPQIQDAMTPESPVDSQASANNSNANGADSLGSNAAPDVSTTGSHPHRSGWTAVNLPSPPVTRDASIQKESVRLPPVFAPAQRSVESPHTNATQPPNKRLRRSISPSHPSSTQLSTSTTQQPKRSQTRGRSWAEVIIGDSVSVLENDNGSRSSHAPASPSIIDVIETGTPERSPLFVRLNQTGDASQPQPRVSNEDCLARQAAWGGSLRAAADRGDLSAVREILQTTSVDVNSKSTSGETALHRAIHSENVEIIQALLEAESNQTPNRDWLLRFDIFQVAIEADKRRSVDLLTLSSMHHPDKEIDQYWREETIIRSIKYAVRMNRMECLKIMVRQVRQHRCFPWQYIVYFTITGGYSSALQVLIDHSVNIDIPLEYEDYPLHAVLWTQQSSIAVAMINFLKNKGVSLHQRDGEGREPIHLAAYLRQDQALKLLLQCQVSPDTKSANGRTPFSYLQMSLGPGSAETCALHLAQAGADLNTKNTNGNTILHYNPRFAGVLVPAGANPNARNLEAETPLVWAALLGDVEGVSQLLASKANPNSQDARGQTALIRATERMHPQIVQMLLDSGADPNLKGMMGNTALHQACKLVQGAECRRLLLNAGASPDIPNMLGDTAKTIWQSQSENLRKRYNSYVQSST